LDQQALTPRLARGPQVSSRIDQCFVRESDISISVERDGPPAVCTDMMHSHQNYFGAKQKSPISLELSSALLTADCIGYDSQFFFI
jgi:hypothetical protein